jgi:hypothetical protein
VRLRIYLKKWTLRMKCSSIESLYFKKLNRDDGLISRELTRLRLFFFNIGKQNSISIQSIIAQIARDHLAVPAASAASERVFSQGADIVTKKRNRLLPSAADDRDAS